MAERLTPQRFEGDWQGQRVGLFTLEHPSGMSAAICNLGAKVLQWRVPSAQGPLVDVCLGYQSLQEVLSGAPSMGAFIARYAGRIGQSCYELQGRSWTLPANDGAHCLHGGPMGSRHRVFQVLAHDRDRLVLGLRLSNALDGHPGEVDLKVSYRWSDQGGLLIEHMVTWVSGPASPISCTPHLFFKLNDDPTIDDHTLWVDGAALLVLDGQGVATGERHPLDAVPWGLQAASRLGSCPPLDHAFELRPCAAGDDLRCVARLSVTSSGLCMSVWTTEPVMQVYTADTLGEPHGPRSAVCLEPQRYPNAMNCSTLPQALVAPQQVFRSATEYRFHT